MTYNTEKLYSETDISTQWNDTAYALVGIIYKPQFKETPTTTLSKKTHETNTDNEELEITVRYITGEEQPISPKLDTDGLESNIVDL